MHDRSYVRLLEFGCSWVRPRTYLGCAVASCCFCCSSFSSFSYRYYVVLKVSCTPDITVTITVSMLSHALPVKVLKLLSYMHCD